MIVHLTEISSQEKISKEKIIAINKCKKCRKSSQSEMIDEYSEYEEECDRDQSDNRPIINTFASSTDEKSKFLINIDIQ